MSYSARVVHRTPGRLRLQIEGEPAALTPEVMRATMVQLQGYSMSQRVRGNPLTRTIVIEGESDQALEKVLDQAEEQGVLRLRTSLEAPQGAPREDMSVAAALGAFREKCDGFLAEVSDGRLDLKSTIAWGMAGLGLKQSLSGKFLPAGMTLMMYAIGMLELDQMDKRRRGEAEA